MVTNIYHACVHYTVTAKNETTKSELRPRILFEKMYVLNTTKYEVKIAQLANGKILMTVMVRPRKSPSHLAGFRNIPAPLRYQIIKDLVNQKMAYILDQIQ